MFPQTINRKVAFLMASLGVYGVLLILIANKNISPYAYIMNSFYASEVSPTLSSDDRNISATPNLRADVSPTRQLASNYTVGKIDETPASLKNDTVVDRFNGLDSKNGDKLTVNSSMASSLSSNISSNSTVNNSSHDKNLQPNKPPLDEEVLSTPPPITEAPTPSPPQQPLLTMFTTFKNSVSKDHIYRNTIHNWALLEPYVKPVMYVIPGEIDLAEYGKSLGWDSYVVPKTSKQGVPILRHMFLDAQSKYNSTFYAYTNGDILFTQNLVDTLKAIVPYKDKINKMLLVGRRTNCNVKPDQKIRSLEEVARIIKTGKLFNSNAQDYFISTRNGYPWDTIPDFVVGRVGYDNWLVVTALTKGMALIDLSGTVSAMHQTGTDGNMAGHSKKPKGDTYINYGLAGKKFDYSLGHVTCGQLFTVKEDSGIKVVERKKNGCEKTFKKFRKNPYLTLPRR